MRRFAVILAATVLVASCARDDTVMADREVMPKGERVETLANSIGMQGVLDLPHRSESRARDRYRHPMQTLAFFNVQPFQTVIEVTPGGGWYTEILGPYLHVNGKLILQVFDPATASKSATRDYYAKSNGELRAKLAADPPLYDRVVVVESPIMAPSLGSPGSADRVLTFRNVHNWTGAGTDAAMFKSFFDVLKPGGVLGVVEHRAAPGTDSATSAKSGYITEAYVIGLAEQAGFKLDGRSEINANPADTHDHANGVWTLPPGLRVPKGEKPDRYQAIGESDRMTLRFMKPAG